MITSASLLYLIVVFCLVSVFVFRRLTAVRKVHLDVAPVQAAAKPPPKPLDLHVFAYRRELDRQNDRNARLEYIETSKSIVPSTIFAIEAALPVAEAIDQLHRDIMSSPASRFWPVVKKGWILVPVAERTSAVAKAGRKRFIRRRLPGHHLFNKTFPDYPKRLQQHLERLAALEERLHRPLESFSYEDALCVSNSLAAQSQKARTVILQIVELQDFLSESVADALRAWNDREDEAPRLRIEELVLYFEDCEGTTKINIPGDFTKPLFEPAEVDQFRG